MERQLEDCLALVAARWPGCAVEQFVDNDISAADPSKTRPRWLDLLAGLRAGELDEIVAYDQSRLTRQPAEWEQLLVILARRKITAVHTVREGDRSILEGEGRLMSRIVAAVDAEYVEANKMRVRRAMRRLAGEGRPTGGRSFGYRGAIGPDGRRTLEVVAEEADAIRWAADAVLRGDTLASIARAFTARGIPQCRQGRGWTPTTIRALLTKPSVAGLRPDPDGLLISAVWEPILQRSTWSRVQGVLSSPMVLVRADGTLYRTERRHRRSIRHLLSGLAVCGVCGAPVVGSRHGEGEVDRRGNPRVVYSCNARIGRGCVGMVAHRLEPIVVEAVLEVVEHGAGRHLLGGRDPQRAAALVGELEALDGDLRVLASEWGKGRIRHAEWSEARRAFVRRASTCATSWAAWRSTACATRPGSRGMAEAAHGNETGGPRRARQTGGGVPLDPAPGGLPPGADHLEPAARPRTRRA